MSPRAACRLATLGFTEVYDYMPGKVDWLARGLPREGEKADEPRALDFARDDTVTCSPADRVAEVRDAVEASPYGFAFVVDGGVLLGRLRGAALEGDGELTTEEVMEPGPSTVRADTLPATLAERLARQGLKTAVISDPEGRLMGVVRGSDLEQ
jgi:CBS domain-containing protein